MESVDEMNFLDNCEQVEDFIQYVNVALLMSRDMKDIYLKSVREERTGFYSWRVYYKNKLIMTVEVNKYAYLFKKYDIMFNNFVLKKSADSEEEIRTAQRNRIGELCFGANSNEELRRAFHLMLPYIEI